MEEFTTIEQLAQAKTRDDIIAWADCMQKCPYDMGGVSFEEDVCKEGDDQEQCHQCWYNAIKDLVCKGDQTEKKPKAKGGRKPKAETNKAVDKAVENETVNESTNETTNEAVSESPTVESNDSDNIPTPDPKLAAKNSADGVKALKALCKTVTREQFLAYEQCPGMYGFPDTMQGCDGAHKISHQCADCWKVILDSMTFKQSTDGVKNNTDSVKNNTATSSEQRHERPQPATVENDIKEMYDVLQPRNEADVIAYVDGLVEQIKELQANIANWDDIQAAKIERVKSKIQEEKDKIQRQIDFISEKIRVEMPRLTFKETKTQRSVKLICGSLVVKKEGYSVECNKAETLAAIVDKPEFASYIKQKADLDWKELKKRYEVQDNRIIDSATGEVVTLPGITLKHNEERLEIK